MQDVDRVADVESLSEPAGLRRPCVDVNAFSGISFAKHGDGISRYRRQRRAFDQRRAVGAPEIEFTIRLSLHLKPFFMNRPVVPAAEHREIRERRRTAVRPVLDVMSLPEPPAAAGEPTALIAMFERTP